MTFTQEDFNKHSQRFQLIIMCQMNKSALTKFSQLNENDKKEFNKLLNQYIHLLPNEKWIDVLDNDFYELCSSHIFTSDFDPSNYYVKDVNVNPELLS